MPRIYMQIEPTKWAFVAVNPPPKRGELPLPYVISDHMEPTEQVDGKFYTSKRAFRAVGRSHGLIEIGTEKLPTKKVRATTDKSVAFSRRQSLRKAIEKYKAGQRSTLLPRSD
jgi:hypothetical protein